MAGKQPKERKPIEVVASFYWPTRILKTISINDPNESYGASIKLSGADARYVLEQMKDIIEPDKLKQLASK